MKNIKNDIHKIIGRKIHSTAKPAVVAAQGKMGSIAGDTLWNITYPLLKIPIQQVIHNDYYKIP
jgi:hypothetical protein